MGGGRDYHGTGQPELREARASSNVPRSYCAPLWTYVLALCVEPERRQQSDDTIPPLPAHHMYPRLPTSPGPLLPSEHALNRLSVGDGWRLVLQKKSGAQGGRMYVRTCATGTYHTRLVNH